MKAGSEQTRPAPQIPGGTPAQTEAKQHGPLHCSPVLVRRPLGGCKVHMVSKAQLSSPVLGSTCEQQVFRHRKGGPGVEAAERGTMDAVAVLGAQRSLKKVK